MVRYPGADAPGSPELRGRFIMSRISLSLFTAAAVVLTGGASSYGDPPSQAQVTREYLGNVRTETGRLAWALEQLQDSIVGELSGQKERTLYRKADAALGKLEKFRAGLVDSASSKRLFE